MNHLNRQARLVPAVALFFVAPLIGEFLLGNLPITWLWALLALAPLYGGGALLIRETVRRFQLGWPSMVLLGLTYAIVEEAFVTQSLFNPNFLGLRLLDYGYIDSLGISIWWTVFVLGIHTIWSTAVPIALVETLVPEIRHTPWLRPVGLLGTAIIFLLGCAVTFIIQQQDPFMASHAQLFGSGVIAESLIIIALSLGRFKLNIHPSAQSVPQARIVGVIAFLLGSAFMMLAVIHNAIPVTLNVVGMVLIVVFGGALFLRWSKHSGWSVYHSLAVSSGLVLTYAWYGFVQIPSTGYTNPLIDTSGNAIFVGCAVVLLITAKNRLDENSRNNIETLSSDSTWYN
ncbi:hypothetical protein [Haladaptatus sp. CMAA 1911]|uniref:hypothetical protein n=1 Tax=unclassified Haladaptatus TaxID=2622732 RepID=UPI003754E995